MKSEMREHDMNIFDNTIETAANHFYSCNQLIWILLYILNQ